MEKLTIYPIQRKGNMFEEKLVSACRGITNEMCIFFFVGFYSIFHLQISRQQQQNLKGKQT